MLVFLGCWSAIVVVLFLLLAGFMDQWDGRAVSVRAAGPNQHVYQVLILETDGKTEREWPALATEGLDLAIDRFATPIDPVLDELPATTKHRFSLDFTVTPVDGRPMTHTTATPQILGLSVFLFLLGLAGRNMVVAGNPLSIEPRGVTLPRAQAPAGQAAPTDSRRSKRSRGRQGPPPPKRRRGSGRRR